MKEWMDRLFRGPTTPDVDRLMELDEFCGPDTATFERLATVFEHPAMLEPYPEESIAQALWDLSSNVMFALSDQSIESDLRHRLIRSFEILFREFFALRCSPALGHLSEGGSLNTTCYMWWDLGCWHSTPGPLAEDPLDSAYLGSMKSILSIDHAACQESALHGLGHWHREHSADVERIIDEFLAREPELRAELREYAHAARAGMVL